jgi:general secretion pathway protein D
MTWKPQNSGPVAKCVFALAMAGASITAWGQVPATPSNTMEQSPAPPSPPKPSKRQIAAANAAYIAGARLMDRHDLAGALTEFQKAATLDPTNQDYTLAADLIRENRVTELVQQAARARSTGDAKKAKSLLAEAAALDPQNNIVRQHLEGIHSLQHEFNPVIEPTRQQGPAIAGAISLVPNMAQLDFHVRGEAREVIRQVVSAYGIKPSFDDSVQQSNLRVDLEKVPYQQASQIVLQMAHTFAVPIDSQTILVAKDTPENRQRLEHQLQETIYVPALTPEQMSELKTVMTNVFDIKQASIQNSSGTLVVRAPEDTLSAVNLTLSDLLDGNAEVLLDVNLYSVDRSRTVGVGTQLPQQIGMYSVAGEAQSIVSSNQSLVNEAISEGLVPANASNIEIALALVASGLVQNTLVSSTVGLFGGGLTEMGLTATPNVSFELSLSSSDTRELDNLQLRVGDRQAGVFRSGTKYPIQTGSYSSGLSGTAAQLAGVTINGVSASSLLSQTSSVTIPQIQYQDLGLTLKATPTVQKSGRVALHLELKIDDLTGTTLNNMPIIGTRQFTSDITVNDGETTLLASSLTKQESSAIAGMPGLGELPGFQALTSQKTNTTDTNEIVLLITPHVVRHRSSAIAGPRIALNMPPLD